MKVYMSELFGFLAYVQCEAAGEMEVGGNLGGTLWSKKMTTRHVLPDSGPQDV